MSNPFELVRNEAGTNMEVNETRDISPLQDGGIRKQLLTPGQGDEYPSYGDTLTIKYTAYYGDEPLPEYIFDSSEKDGKLFKYECLKGRVVKGFEYGILTMKMGEHANIFLKPEYAYGRGGSEGKVPPETPVLFDTEIVSIECPDLSQDADRTLLKKTLIKGKGHSYPNQGAMVDLHIKGECDGRVFMDKDVQFELGEGTSGSNDIPKCVEDNLKHWKTEEYARLFVAAKHAYGEKGNEKYGIGPNKDLMFYIKMKNFEKSKEFWEMDSREKMDQCDAYKLKGNNYYKKEEFVLAEQFYEQMVEAIQNDTCMQGEEEIRRKQLVIVGNLNLAQAKLKLEKYTEARGCCRCVLKLDPSSAKGFYRCGLANFNLQEFSDAKSDFEKVLELEPDNKSAKKHVVLCINKIKDSEESSKSLAKKMMSEVGKGQDEGWRRYASGMNDISNWDNAMAHGMMTLEEECAAFGDPIPQRGGNNHGVGD